MRLPVDRFHAGRAARRLLELPGDLLQVAARLLRVIADRLEKSLPEGVLLLQADEEVHKFQVGIDLLEAAQDAAVSRIGVVWPWEVAGIVEQIARPGDRFTETRRRTFPGSTGAGEQLGQAVRRGPQGGGDQ